MKLIERISLGFLFVMACIGFASITVGCTRKEEMPAAKPEPLVVRKTAPDEHGVVCYSSDYRSLSCLKVVP